ncbi:hypothetical protein F7734_51950 [Scytonema sp. UIC 10036]|uniref:hypothetical protein n=1 Tax=Scytonema sp. UIC 10036 TaxID=2304196 RepID=UPI0012DABFDD|nr:hypothetical protein [Scytonema sp. UIC 10036]MUH00340.1 hypothetical protein [Scytonema sp. UIC 10036]
MTRQTYTNSQLIEQMQESWGQQFEQLNISEKIWLLSYVIGHMAADESEVYKPMEIDDCVSMAGERMSELSFYQQIDLAKALINQIENNYLHG